MFPGSDYNIRQFVKLEGMRTKLDNLLWGTKPLGMWSLGVVLGGQHHIHSESM